MEALLAMGDGNFAVAAAAGGAGLTVILIMAAAFGSNRGAERRVKRRIDNVRERQLGTAVEAAASMKLSEAGSSIPGLDQALNRWLPRREILRERLVRTGRSFTVAQYVLVTFLLIAVEAAISHYVIGMSPVVSLLLGVVSGVGLPHFVVGRMIDRRLKAFTTLFPEAIDLMVRGLKSGLPITESIAVVGHELVDPVGIEFRRIDHGLKFGQSFDEALWAAAKRLDTAEFKFFVISLSVQRETGGNLAETLENLSDILRRRRQMRLKVKAMSSEAKASAYIIGSLPFVMFAILMVVNAKYVLQLFHDPRGIMMVGVGLVMLCIGVFVMAKMVKFEI